MADGTKIEWTAATWNPIRARNPFGKIGWHCVHASEGCRNCYAEAMNRRLGTGLPYAAQSAKDVTIFLDEEMLTRPLRWKAPRKIFVGSMTDLFGEFVPDAMIDKVFAVMALAPQHIFQVLTKRAARMREYLSHADCAHRLQSTKWFVESPPRIKSMMPWPLPNLWLGVSAEDQANADARIPDLLATPAAKRFVSAEPMIGPIRLDYLARSDGAIVDALHGETFYPGAGSINSETYRGKPRLDWLIVGGESGPHARPFDTAWARGLLDQCRDAGIACFVKQLGAHVIQGGARRTKRDRKGGDMSEWPHEIRVREFPA